MKQTTLRAAPLLTLALAALALACTEESPPSASVAPDDPNNDPGNNEPGNNEPGNNAPNNAPNNDPGNNDPGNNDPGNNDPGNNDPGVLTYFKDVKPLIDANCNGCHTEGGVGPFRLETYEQVLPLSSAIKTAVQDRTMPPWLPAEGCRDIKGSRALTQAEIDTISRWVDEGSVAGDPADDPRAQPEDILLQNPDLILKAAEAYTANPQSPDDYRCLVLDHDFNRDTWLSAYQVVPDKRAIVHHVLFYLVPPGEVAGLDRLEREDRAPGYECFGGPRAGDLLGTVAGWVPGSGPTFYPPDSAYLIPAGSKIVMQIHYNLLGAEPASDRTEIHMKLLPEPPANLVKIVPVPVPNLDIEAGDPESTHQATYPNPFGKTLTIVGTAPHMHMLGSKISARVNHADGSRSCVVDIPEYDFNWQQFYEFDPSAYFDFEPGDTVSLSCTYDNSAANQAVVNGQQLEPRDVQWGDGSLDEMCLLYLTTIEPFDGVSTCSLFDACNDACAPDDGACTLSCISNGGGDCRQCAVFGLGECAADRCGQEAQPMIPCMLGCLQAEDVGACFADRCPAQFDTLWGCLGRAFYDGQCNGQIAQCNLAQ